MPRRAGKRKVKRRENRFEKPRWTRKTYLTANTPLSTWATRNANLHQEFPALKIVSMLAEHAIEVSDLGLQSGAWKPEEYDASVSQLLLEDQLAEVAVGNDQDPLLFLGD